MALVRVKRRSNLVGDLLQKHYLKACSTLNAEGISKQPAKISKTYLCQKTKGFIWHVLSNPDEEIKNSNPIVSYLAHNLNMPINTVLYSYFKYPKKKLLQLENVESTLKFLRQYGFETRVIAESVTICFYPRENITKALEKIAENESILSKVGLSSGYTSDVTMNFTNGTVCRDKRLQLCLYYMELPYEFSGYGQFFTE